MIARASYDDLATSAQTFVAPLRFNPGSQGTPHPQRGVALLANPAPAQLVVRDGASVWTCANL
jgi:hypothetical protein